jgi:hypothetical protein
MNYEPVLGGMFIWTYQLGTGSKGFLIWTLGMYEHEYSNPFEIHMSGQLV